MHRESHSSPPETLHDSDRSIIDTLGDRFEGEWKAGERPDIERYLQQAPEKLHAALLRELLMLDLEYRLNSGERVEAEEYLRRFPTRTEEIEYAWQVITAEYEPETLKEAGRSSNNRLLDTAKQGIAHQVLDGRAYSPRDQWHGQWGDGTQDTPDSLLMQSELTSVTYHARGGLGVVCVAHDQRLNRPMAVKFIRRELADVEECRERLQLEAEITSRLEHPGVVPVYGIGNTADDRLFYAMRFIHGETLDAAIERCHRESAPSAGSAEHDIRLREMLSHFVAVCKTVAYAHERGIIHRDIKPANIMLGRYGETTLVDWGLAIPVPREGLFKVATEETLKLSSGSDAPDSSGGVAGTPAFMSPEQAAGDMCLRPASDIYSLGATLYKLMTGKAPFSGPLHTVRAKVLRGDYARPSELDRRASKALEAICLKAMAIEPEDRYQTALDLARDVEHFLGDADVAAYREPASRRIARWARRHWAGVQLAVMAFALIAMALLVAAVFLGRQARLESDLKLLALASEEREHAMRKQGVSASAEFAAQMIAHQVDLRWCVLEKIASDSRLHETLQIVNEDPTVEANWQPLQAWLDQVAQTHNHVSFHALFVNSADGTQVARHPYRKAAGDRMPSIGKNFRYRDYFHGLGADFYDDPHTPRTPCTVPHVSTAIESSNYAQLAVVFSVPIRVNHAAHPVGTLGMMVSLGDFAALEVSLPPGQRILLVDTRDYLLQRTSVLSGRDEDDLPSAGSLEPGAGLVLYHQAPSGPRHLDHLPHIDDATLEHLRDWNEQVIQHLHAGRRPPSLGTLLPDDFVDPVVPDQAARQLAAGAPVIVQSRSVQLDIGWSIIIHQAE